MKWTGSIVLATLIALAVTVAPGCVLHQQPPPGTYDAGTLRAFNADQFVKDLQALSETVINLNEAEGGLHVSDQDTRYVRDFALAASDGAVAYANGSGTASVIRTAWDALNRDLSQTGKRNSALLKALRLIEAGIKALPSPPSSRVWLLEEVA